MGRAEVVWKCASVLNFLLFLWGGRYPQLLERILGLPLRPISPFRARSVAFDYMNRQLVWQGLTEFLLFFAPLISMGRMVKFFRRNAPNPSLAVDECGICGVRPLDNPHGSSTCRHAACYFCIAQKLEDDADYPCPKCGHSITKDNLVRLTLNQ